VVFNVFFREILTFFLKASELDIRMMESIYYSIQTAIGGHNSVKGGAHIYDQGSPVCEYFLEILIFLFSSSFRGLFLTLETSDFFFGKKDPEPLTYFFCRNNVLDFIT
jgi:hypothetical protein